MYNWYLQTGKDSDVALSTRIRLARNLNNIPFVSRYTKDEANQILEKIENITPSLGYGLKFLKLDKMDAITKLSLIEKHLISPEFAVDKNKIRAILINEEENICIMVNEEDHLRLQIISAGLDLENTLNLAVEIDKKLESLVNYAFSEKYGFLTACPTNVGTGLRASVMVHLPALTLTGNIKKVLEAVNSFGMNIRGVYGEGSKPQGDIYQISNKQSLGISENEIIKNLKAVIDRIIEQERTARKILGNNQIELEDRVYRAYGILTSCKKISSEECKELLSNIKLGTDMGIIKELNDLKVNKLILYTKPANLQKYIGKPLEDYERDIKRAEIIKQIICE
ncbi:MAG: protein arginine kinase [Oscillospiraceae bacterium]|nr:protein arginine kinase [Oscillospiraceae bacterium]